MLVGSGLELAELRFTAKAAADFEEDGVEFDPTIIIMIISALVPLIADCFKRGRQVSAGMLRDRNNLMRVASLVRKEARLRWSSSVKLARRLFEVADEATDDECKIFVDDCRCCV